MATFKAKKFREALKKAKNVGRAEDSVTIDGCTIVLQSLTPEMHDDIRAETEDAEDGIFNLGFQLATVCRAIVEIEGQDLRNVEVVEDDVPAGNYVLTMSIPNEVKALTLRDQLQSQGVSVNLIPPSAGTDERTILMERHEWIRQQLSTWSREAINVAFRKSLDVLAMGEARANQDVKFTYVGETNEEKYRRLLTELKEVEGSLPEDLVVNTLGEVGYLLKTSTDELQRVASQLNSIETQQPTTTQKPVKTSEFTVASDPPAPIQISSNPERTDPLLQDRVPMNQPAQPAPVRVPTQLRNEPMSELRAARLAEMEGVEELYKNAQSLQEPTVLSHNQQGINGAEVAAIIDQPPPSGINPKFYRRPNR